MAKKSPWKEKFESTIRRLEWQMENALARKEEVRSEIEMLESILGTMKKDFADQEARQTRAKVPSPTSESVESVE